MFFSGVWWVFGGLLGLNFSNVSKKSIIFNVRRRGREVEGTPLLREHAGKTCIEGSNPSVSANPYNSMGCVDILAVMM